MNERIRELVKQHSVDITIDDMGYGEGNIEGLIELIVRECIAQCQSQNKIITTVTGTTHWGTISDAVEQIQEHFEVEEC